jgi:hypothetical protein
LIKNPKPPSAVEILLISVVSPFELSEISDDIKISNFVVVETADTSVVIGASDVDAVE